MSETGSLEMLLAYTNSLAGWAHRAERVAQKVYRCRYHETSTYTWCKSQEAASHRCACHCDPLVPDHNATRVPQCFHQKFNSDVQNKGGCEYGGYVRQDMRRNKERAESSKCDNSGFEALTVGTVEDSGIGIYLENVNNLFRPRTKPSQHTMIAGNVPTMPATRFAIPCPMNSWFMLCSDRLRSFAAAEANIGSVNAPISSRSDISPATVVSTLHSTLRKLMSIQ
jgi:hypothetical protein